MNSTSRTSLIAPMIVERGRFTALAVGGLGDLRFYLLHHLISPRSPRDRRPPRRGFKDLVPREPEVFAIDRRFALNAARRLPHGSFAWPCGSTRRTTSRVIPLIVRSRRHRFRRRMAAERASPRNAARILRHIEEVGRLEVRVAVGHAGVDAGRVDRHRDGRLREVAVRHVHRARPAGKRPSHLRDDQVPDEKCTLEWLLSISQRSVLIAPLMTGPFRGRPKRSQQQCQEKRGFDFNHLRAFSAQRLQE